jgi:hypothetical protein
MPVLQTNVGLSSPLMMNSAQRSKLAGPAQGCPAAEPVAEST